MTRTRWFARLPASDDVEAALDHAARLGGAEPRLFRCDSAVVVGSVELPAEPREETQR